MLKRKKAEPSQTYFETIPQIEIDGFVIEAGEMIKIKGEYGGKFKLIGLTKNNLTGAQWVDCYEIIGGVPSVFRSFQLDQIKRIPQRGKRGKRVSGTGSD